MRDWSSGVFYAGSSFVSFVSTCIMLWAQTFHGLMDGLALICVPELGRGIHSRAFRCDNS